MSPQPSATSRQSVKMPPVACGPHSMHMAGQAAGGEPVVVVAPPAEFVDQRPERQRGVDAAAGDHDVGAGGQRRGDRLGAEIGVDARAAFGGIGAPLNISVTPRRAQLLGAGEQIVAFDDGDLERDAGLRAARLRSARAAGVRD